MGANQLLNLVDCTADFPDDYVWDDEGEVICVGGAGIASAIAAGLAAKGFDVTEPVVDDDHGWCFDVKWNARSFWVLASDVGHCIISTEQHGRRFLDWLLGKPDEEYRAFLRVLHEVLTADGRFHDVKWYAERNYSRDAIPADRPAS